MITKVLLTGANGLLGQKLVHLYRKDERTELLATATGPNRISEQQGYTYRQLDITNPDQVNLVCEQFRPDVIINTAAMTNVDACETEKEKCWQVNVEAVSHLIEVAGKYDSHLIQLSTDFVFDGQSGPYSEEDQPNPLSYYALSKWEAEKLVANSGLKKWAIARTIIIYGIVEGMSRSNLVLWAKGALEKGERINVVNDQFRFPTLAEDLAVGCKLIAEKGATGIYHMSGPDGGSILDLVYQVADFFKLDKNLINPITTDSLNQSAKRPPKTGFVIEKARRDLGYQPHTFTKGLAILAGQLRAK